MTNKKNIDSLEEYLEDDPTDELPILSESALSRMTTQMGDAGLGVEETGERPALRMDAEASKAANWTLLNESSSLQRLEDEFQTLQARWSTIEEELRQRDTEVSRLQGEMQARGSAIEALEDELRGAITARQDLEQSNRGLREIEARYLEQLETQQQLLQTGETELQQTRQELVEARQTLAKLSEQVAEEKEHEQELQASQTELQQAQLELDNARQEIAALGEQVNKNQNREQELQAQAETQFARAQDLEKAVFRGRQRLQDLETYIEGRRSRWSAVQEACEQQTRVINSLEKAAGAKEQQLARHRQAQLRLEKEVGGLERQLIQFRERASAAEAQTQEKTTSLVARDQELIELTRQLAEQQAAAESMQQQCDRSTGLPGLRPIVVEHDLIAFAHIDLMTRCPVFSFSPG